MRKKISDELALTDDEIQVLGSSRTPEMVREFIARQQQNVGTRTSAYRKVAAMARAEREALTEIALLRIARERVGESAEAKVEQPALARPDAMMPPLMSVPSRAMAVHSD